MNIGAMRERVTFQREVRPADGMGGYETTWQDIAEVAARVQPLSGRERFAAQQLQNPVTHRVTIRARRDIDGATRIDWCGRLLNIRSILNLDERNRYQTIDAEEGVAV